MKVLIACEESQEVCKAFREMGHIAFSCDLQECSGGHPEWHIYGDALPLLDGNCHFKTMTGDEYEISGEWDLLIAHPPCTYLTVTGNSWFNIEKYGAKAKERYNERYKAIVFFMHFCFCSAKHIAIENPIGIMSTAYRKPDQIIQPYYFGDPARKSTCLWLKNLPLLQPTIIVDPEVIRYKNGKGTDNPWHMNTISLSPPERAKARSKTFRGFAKAMAEQWGNEKIFL